MKPNGISFHDIIEVHVLDGYVLRLVFDDGTQQDVDFEPLLNGPMFAPLQDMALFRQVQVNRDTGTIEWSNGADFSPDLLYNWPKFREQVVAERKQRYTA